MELSRDQIITLVCIVAAFLAVFVFWFHSPFYKEKKAVEREKAIEWLVLNDPANNPTALFHQGEFEVLTERRQYLMNRYGITESELEITVTPPEEKSWKQRLLDLKINGVVKFLLGYDKTVP